VAITSRYECRSLPHRATPATIYTTLPKATPSSDRIDDTHDRVRRDKIDSRARQSRATFRTPVWRPAIERSGIRQLVRFHDLRGAHASWLLAGGADLKAVMDRVGHKQIQTTQQHLGRLPDADDRAFAAFETVRHRRS
jgi:integrase